ncbi:MAG: DUF2071 domain-containing protein [Thermoanaerobaculia bacterium]
MTGRSIPFMTAAWKRLAIVTFKVPDDVIAPYLVPGTEPDRWEGSALASVVAFEFEKMSVFGIPAFGFRSFPEWNLRFYVRCPSPDSGETESIRRGVTFVTEFVPGRIVAGMARALYDEPYRAVPYSLDRHAVGTSQSMDHVVELGGRTHRFRFIAGGAPVVPPPDSLAHFLKEQEWGFGTTRGGRRGVYRVEHPRWGVHPETRFDLDVDFGALYGERWSLLDHATPISKIVVEGSPIKVFTRTVEAP